MWEACILEYLHRSVRQCLFGGMRVRDRNDRVISPQILPVWMNSSEVGPIVHCDDLTTPVDDRSP